MVGVAQLVRAPVCGTGGRGFESPYPPHPLLELEVRFAEGEDTAPVACYGDKRGGQEDEPGRPA